MKIVKKEKKPVSDDIQDEILSNVRQKRDVWAELGAQVNDALPDDEDGTIPENTSGNEYLDDLLNRSKWAEDDYLKAVNEAAEILPISHLKGELASLRRINRDLDTKFLREKEQQILWQRQWDIEAFLCGWLDTSEYVKL